MSKERLSVSSRFDAIPPSATMRLTARVKTLKSEGVDVISFAAGEPHFDPPAFLCDAMKEALDGSFAKYTPVPGLMDVRKTISNWVNQTYGRDTTPEWICLTHGVKGGLHSAIQVLLNPGDEVVFQSPYWVSYPPLAQISGGISKLVSTTASDSFKMTPEALDAAISERTKVFVLGSPQNPTGVAYSQAELDSLVAVLAKYPWVWVVSDDIYDHVTWVERAHVANSPKIDPWRLVQAQGLSKSHAVTGWRCGFLCANPDLVKRMSLIMGHSLSHVPGPMQHVMKVAYSSDFSFLKARVAYYENNMKNGLSVLRQQWKTDVVEPDGAFYMFPSVSRLFEPLSKAFGVKIEDDMGFCETILEKLQVGFVPGSAFGAPGHVRITTAMTAERFLEGLNRVSEVIGAH